MSNRKCRDLCKTVSERYVHLQFQKVLHNLHYLFIEKKFLLCRDPANSSTGRTSYNHPPDRSQAFQSISSCRKQETCSSRAQKENQQESINNKSGKGCSIDV